MATSSLSPITSFTPAPPAAHSGTTAAGDGAAPAHDSFARALDQASSSNRGNRTTRSPERGMQRTDEGAEERATDAAAGQAPATAADPAAAVVAAAAATTAAAAAAADAAGIATLAETTPPARATEPESTEAPVDASALLAGWLNWAPTRSTLPAAPKENARSTATPVAATQTATQAATAERTRPGLGAAGPDAATPALAEPTPLHAAAAAAAADAAASAATAAPPVASPLPAAPPVAGLPGAATAASAAFEGHLPASPGSAEFAPQLGAQLSVFVRDGIQHARLHLHPAEMGPLTVQIQLDGTAAQVNLAAEHVLTRQALEQAMPSLAGALRDAGLTLTGGGVFERPRDSQPQPERHPTGDSGRRDSGAPDALPATLAAPAGAMRRGVVDLVA